MKRYKIENKKIALDLEDDRRRYLL
jgi:hypothetical protein